MKKENEALLEEAAKRVESYHDTKPPPFFEMYLTLFSIFLAIMLLLAPNMLDRSSEVYIRLLLLLPQDGWALLFFVGSMIMAFGLLFDKSPLRVVGLSLSAAMYAVFAVVYLMSFPTIGAAVFVVKVIFTLLSIPYVKDTGIRRERK